MAGDDEIQRALGEDANLQEVKAGLIVARAKVEEFVASHKDEVHKAKTEQDILLAEENELRQASALDASTEIAELQAAEAEVVALRGQLSNLTDREEILQQLTALHNFHESFQTRLAGRELKELAEELSSLRTVADDLPKRDGRTGRLTSVARAVKPAVRKMIGQLKSRIGEFISHLVQIEPASLRVRVPPALKKGKKSGDGGCGGALFQALDALDLLQEGDAADGGKGESGGGGPVMEGLVEGLRKLLQAAFEGKKLEAKEEQGKDGDDLVFSISLHAVEGRSDSASTEATSRLGTLEAVATFVVRRMWGDGEVGAEGRWLERGRESLWAMLSKGLAGAIMGGAPSECYGFKGYHEEVSPLADKFAKKMRVLGLGKADAGGEEVRAVVRLLGKEYVERRKAHYLERVRRAVKGASADVGAFMKGVQRIGGGGEPDSGVLMGGFGLPPCDVSTCAMEVLATLQGMVEEAEGCWDDGRGQEVVKGLRRELLEGTRGVVDVYLAVTESVMGGKAKELNFVAVILHNDCMLLADALLPLQVRWRRVMEGKGAGAGGQVGIEGCLVDMASALRARGGVFGREMVARITRRQQTLVEGEGGGLRGLHSAGAREDAEGAIEQAKEEMLALGTKILWPDAPQHPPAVPVPVYRRLMGGLIDGWYQILIRNVLAMEDIPAVQIKPLQEVLGKAKCEEALKRGEQKIPLAAVRAYIPNKEKLSMLIDLLDFSLVEIRNLNASNALSAFTVEEVQGLLRALFAQSDKLDQALQAVEHERGHERGG